MINTSIQRGSWFFTYICICIFTHATPLHGLHEVTSPMMRSVPPICVFAYCLTLTLTPTIPHNDTIEEGYTSSTSTQWSKSNDNDQKGIGIDIGQEEGAQCTGFFAPSRQVPRCIEKLIGTKPNMWDQALECAELTATGGSKTTTLLLE